MAAATISRRARWFVTASALFLVAWQAAVLAGADRRTSVALGLFGFVLHMVFGKALSLVPSYFERDLALPIAPAIQFPLTAGGTIALALTPLDGVPDWVDAAGGIAWFAGVLVFVGALVWSIRDNLMGAETGTGEANADRRGLDRLANAFVPLVFAYLLLGSYATAARETPLPSPLDGYPPRATHLLAAGAATLLVFAIGFRLLPRFLVAHPPECLARIVLPAGALGPVLLAATLPAGSLFAFAAAVEAVAVVGFALGYLVLFLRSDRRRVGFYGVLAGALAGVLGVGLGLQFAVAGSSSDLVGAHLRLNLLGFLGLTIVGVAYQFYPPGAGTLPWTTDRTALASIVAIAGGLGIEVLGRSLRTTAVERAGTALALLGALLYALVLLGLFYERHWS